MLGVVHVLALLRNLPLKIPIYMTLLLVIGVVYYLGKTTPLRMSILGIKSE